MSRIIQLADELVVALNQAFGPSLPAQRVYWTSEQVERLTDKRIVVVPTSKQRNQLTRGQEQWELVLDVAVQQKIAVTNATIDPLMTLVEQVETFIGNQSLTLGRILEVRNEPIYSEEHLKQFGVFTSLLVCTYRAWP
jgi:hypothetical protein